MKEMDDQPRLLRAPVQWTIWGGWLLAAIGFVIWSAVQAAGRGSCEPLDFGCDPALSAVLALALVGPPIVVAAILVALNSSFVGRRAAIWFAVASPPVLPLLFAVGIWA